MAIAPQHRGANKWYCRVDVGEENGKRKYVSRTFKADATKSLAAQRREAEKYTATLQVEHQKGEIAEGGAIPFSKLAEMFIENYCRQKGLSDRSIDEYEKQLRLWLLPYFGKMKVRDINPTAINKFMTHLATSKPLGRTKGEKLSGTTQGKYYGLLLLMMKQAMQWQIISTNPVERVQRPKKDKVEYVILEMDELDLFLERLKDEPLQKRTVLTLALFSQMRRGELVGLDWSRISFQDNTISVLQSAAKKKGGGNKLKSTKNKKSERTIVVSKTAMLLLRELKIEQAERRLFFGEEWISTDAVFTQPTGKRLHIDTPTKWMGKFLVKCGLPKTRLHDLRHLGASLLIREGLDVESVRARLGHSSSSTTLNIYAHSFKERDERPANVLEALLHKEK